MAGGEDNFNSGEMAEDQMLIWARRMGWYGGAIKGHTFVDYVLIDPSYKVFKVQNKVGHVVKGGYKFSLIRHTHLEVEPNVIENVYLRYPDGVFDYFGVTIWDLNNGAGWGALVPFADTLQTEENDFFIKLEDWDQKYKLTKLKKSDFNLPKVQKKKPRSNGLAALFVPAEETEF